jgi:hypothetical protein
VSIERAKDFLRDIPMTPALEERVRALEPRAGLTPLLALARREGYDFSEAHYRAAVVDLAEGELSDAALDQVLDEMFPQNHGEDA